MKTQLDDLLARLVLMRKDAVTGSDSVVAFFYAQESPIFWVNRLVNVSVELESEQLQTNTYTIVMRLVLAKVTQGFEQEAEQMIHTWLPAVLQYFAARRQLKRTVDDAAVSYLDPRGAVITEAVPQYNLQQSGTGATLFGVDFSIEVPMYMATDQVIY